MEDFIPTRAQPKNNNFISVKYKSHKKKIKSPENSSELNINNVKKTPEDVKNQQNAEMKRLRWDIMKFGSSGFSGARKNHAKASLVLQLGGKAVKSRKNVNYKELMVIRARERARLDKLRLKNRESGVKFNLNRVKSKNKRESGILDVYGKIDKIKK